jgi:4-amino-4-deoxy-L-arabinose transferase-like glycosyltransferase
MWTIANGLCFMPISSESNLDGAPLCSEEARLAGRLFWLLVVVHVVVWTVVPALRDPNAPLDMVEMRYWGQQWQLGYHKHPPLPSWIAAAAAECCGGSFWGVYLVAQLGMAAAFWAVWRLGNALLAPRLALLGACLLETSFYYTFNSAEFNNNVAMFPYWALAVLFLYWALESGKNRWWIATGVALGLGLMCKYTVTILAVTMLLFMLLHPAARRAWLRPGPYLTTAFAALVFFPHAAWAVAHRFPTLEYAAVRSRSGPFLIGHLLCPLEFAGSQLLVLLPTAWAILPLTGIRWRLRPLAPAERFHRDFLLAMALGPFALHLLAAGVLNRWLLSAYGSQLWMFTGVLLLFCLATVPTQAALRRSFVRCIAIGIVFVVGFVVHGAATPYLFNVALRIHCPSPALATQVRELWTRRYGQPLPMVAGDWWLASNIAFYGPDCPVIYGGSDLNHLDMGPGCSGWTNDTELLSRGGVVVWNADTCADDPRKILPPRFPRVEFLSPLSIPWQTGAKIPPLQVGVAIIPPHSQHGQR